MEGIRKISRIPVAIITNASLLGEADVAAACHKADLVVPSLDAGGEGTFQAVNRPCRAIRLRNIVEGMVSFRADFQGDMWLEIMMVKGINDDEQKVAEIAEALERIRPDRIQLNTVDRPPSEEFARPVEKSRLQEVACSWERRLRSWKMSTWIAGFAPELPLRKPSGSVLKDAPVQSRTYRWRWVSTTLKHRKSCRVWWLREMPF